jgi:hypothetical protein
MGIGRKRESKPAAISQGQGPFTFTFTFVGASVLLWGELVGGRRRNGGKRGAEVAEDGWGLGSGEGC